ncbi:MAG: hypothetical protein IT379_00100 [Deltaproteobacteria bacterium]|nr:hypothetical protein [Deltaproteobacteria bacterium]
MRAASADLLAASVVALLACAAAPGVAHARKLFIRDISVERACLATSASAVRAIITEQIPRDVLARRGLEYEDISSYLDVSSWAPERFEVRERDSVLRRLQQLDMQYMLVLEVSCMPARGGGQRYILTGRLTDLDAMDRILSCPADQAGEVAGRRVCHVGGEVFDAVRFTHVDFASFDDFIPAVRRLLSRLLQVPELSLATGVRTFDPFASVELPFVVRRNDGTERGYQGPRARHRTYRLAQDVIELPGDVEDAVCAAPEERWAQLSCSAGFSEGPCDRADRVPFAVRTLVHREVVPRARREDEGGDRIVLRAPPHATTYLVRGEIRARERGGVVRSTPVFHCIRIRPRPIAFGFSTRVGFPSDTARSDEPDDPIFPSAGLVAPAFGADVQMPILLFGLRSWLFPSVRAGPVVGFTHMEGSYPCPSRDPTDCGYEGGTYPQLATLSTAITLEARGQMRAEVIRIGPVGVTLGADLGFGAESLSSDPEHTGDGWHAVFLSGASGGLTLHTVLGPTSLAGIVHLELLWQVRSRLGTANRIEPGFVFAPGVPDTVETWWAVIGVDLSPLF